MKVKSYNRITNIRNGLLIIGAIALISLLFPTKKKPKFRYEIGSQWEYDDLYAPFDFSILKSVEQLEEEKQRIKKKKEWFFRRDRTIEHQNIAAVESVFERWQHNRALEDGALDSTSLVKVRSKVLALLQSSFEEGIIDWPDSVSSHPKMIRLIDSNAIRVIPSERFVEMRAVKSKLGAVLSSISPRVAEQLLPQIEPFIHPNIVFDAGATRRFLEARLKEVSTVSGKVRNHEKIIGKGELVTKDRYNKLYSYEKYFKEKVNEDNTGYYRFFGYLILTVLIFVILLLYLYYNFPQVYSKWKHVLFVLMWFVVFGYLVYTVERIPELNTYILPFCIVPIIVKNFFDTRLAIFIHVLLVLMVSYLSSFGYEFTFIEVLVGIVAILSTSETRQWSEFFKSIFLIVITGVLSYFALMLITGIAVNEIKWDFILWFLLNGMFLLLAYPLIPLLERVFGFTSSITLVELSDLNNPLLKDLSLKAPGTMQHSLQVGNIAEAAAKEVQANALLVKVGALYHDIGKMLHPEFFIENQKGDSPHSGLSPVESAKKIIEHVTEGVKMAKKAKLPSVLVDFIRTHHGTTRVEYFYQQSLSNEEMKDKVNESAFRYPGPKPETKEQTILMLVDSVEAASKSLTRPSDEDIDQLVNKIVAHKIELGQLENSHLTFNELNRVVETIKSLLKSIYHVRIKYPGQK